MSNNGVRSLSVPSMPPSAAPSNLSSTAPPAGGPVQADPARAGDVGRSAAPGPLALGGLEVRRLRFVREVPPGATALLTLAEPAWSVIASEPTGVEALAAEAGCPTPADEVLVCLMATGPALALEAQRLAEAWLAEGGMPVAEIPVRGDRIRWRPGRSLVIAGDGRWSELLLAVATFSFYEGELRKLEAELRAALARAEPDADLVGLADRRALARSAEVELAARAAARWRLRFAMLEPHLAQAPEGLPAAAQRAVNELAVQAEVAARLGTVDDRIEVLEDLYGTACERLSEHDHFRREFLLEVAILLVLVVEAALMFADLFHPLG